MPKSDGWSNLTPVSSGDEARTKGRKGGQARVRRAKERRAAAEVLDELLRMPLKDEEIVDLKKVRSIASMKDTNLTAWDVIMAMQVKKAMKGDTKAVELLMSLLGDGGSKTVSPLDSLAKSIEKALKDEGGNPDD